VFFSNSIRLLLIVNKVCVSLLFAIEIGKLAHSLGEGNSPTLLLKQSDIPQIQGKILNRVIVEDIYFC
jgi:hypothetical protein